MSRAYAYDVDIVLSNPNDASKSRVETRRVHAYHAIDAMTQASIEAAATAGSADVKVVRVSPPPEACAPLPDVREVLHR